MTKEQALQQYTNAMQAIEDHIKENKPVFDAHERLVMRTIDAENALRDAVAEAGEGVSNGLYNVTCTPQTQTVFDEDKVKAACPEAISINQRPPRIVIGKNRAGI